MHSSLIRHCFDMCSLKMIRKLIKISQGTQSIESPLNSTNSWVCCFTNNLTTLNHEMTQKVHNMYWDFILIQVTKSFQTYITESLQSYYLPIIGLFYHTYPLAHCIKIDDAGSLHKTHMLLHSLIHHLMEYTCIPLSPIRNNENKIILLNMSKDNFL
jgi:hypothetical protein